MNIKDVYLITFIIYYLIATFFFLNILFNPRFHLTLVNKRTKKEKEPTNNFIIFYSLFWIILVPISIYNNNKGEETK